MELENVDSGLNTKIDNTKTELVSDIDELNTNLSKSIETAKTELNQSIEAAVNLNKDEGIAYLNAGRIYDWVKVEDDVNE